MPTQLLTTMSTRGKITIAASALAFVVVAFLLFKIAGAPSYSTVAAGMDPTETTKVTGALDAAGVKYEIRRGGTELAVEKGMETDARMALATAGVVTTGSPKQPGFELLDKQKLGASSFQQQVAYQRALEGQIAQTIGSIDGVGGAQVRLTLPKDELFADEAKPATAAVLLTGSAEELDPASVKGVANLVASSVPDLDAKKVTITDGAGQMIWPQGDGSAMGADGTGTLGKPAAEARYASQLESSLDALLLRTLGPDKATVQVAADLDLSESTQEKLQYAKKGTPLTETTETETLTSEGAAGGAAAGTAANIPSYAAGAAGGGGESNYRKTTAQRDLGVDKTVTRTKVAPGAVQRLDVAVVVDKKVPAADVAALKTALASAAGIRADRGDTLAVSRVAFAAPPKATTAPPAGALPIPAGMEGIVKAVAIGLGSLFFLFFVTRHLRRREADPFADEPSWLRALPSVEGQAALPAPKTQMEPIDLSPPDEALNVFKNDPRAMALEELVAREPERVAGQLRSWITEDK
jgi:flagellar M-ring protein FliF